MNTLPYRLSPKEFEKSLKAIYSSIFNNRSILDGSPFVNSTWEIALYPYGLNMPDIDYQALACAAKEMEDHEMILTDKETMPLHQETVVLPWDAATFEHARCRGGLASVDCALFGSSGTWGVVAYYDDFGCIGGGHKFMKTYMSKVGGIPFLRERFLNFANNEWAVDEEIKERIVKSIGWL